MYYFNVSLNPGLKLRQGKRPLLWPLRRCSALKGNNRIRFVFFLTETLMRRPTGNPCTILT
ncbi:hypothetical protein CP989_25490, partial [Enterobacter hormaechei]